MQFDRRTGWMTFDSIEERDAYLDREYPTRQRLAGWPNVWSLPDGSEIVLSYLDVKVFPPFNPSTP